MELEHVRLYVDATLGGARGDSSALRLSHSRQSAETQIVTRRSPSSADLVHASLHRHCRLRNVLRFSVAAGLPCCMAFGKSSVAIGARKVDDSLADAVIGGVRPGLHCLGATGSGLRD